LSKRAAAAAAAIARVLRPIVRLALAFGLKYQEIDTVLRDLLISEARRAAGAQHPKSKVNVSQLSVTTGLSRVEIKERTQLSRAVLPATELSYAAKAFTLWQSRAAQDPALRSLPVNAAGDELSFSALARAATRGNVHHRAVLSELIRLQMAQLDGDHVSLLAAAYVPSGDEQEMLAFLADNTRDHLNAAVSNVIGGESPFLERVVFSQGISERDCIDAMSTMRTGWNRVHASLVPQLNQAVDSLGTEPPFRIRLGVYAYYEPWDEEDPAPKESDQESS
jgi:Family of unknown function (DUF6502)